METFFTKNDFTVNEGRMRFKAIYNLNVRRKLKPSYFFFFMDVSMTWHHCQPPSLTPQDTCKRTQNLGHSKRV